MQRASSRACRISSSISSELAGGMGVMPRSRISTLAWKSCQVPSARVAVHRKLPVVLSMNSVNGALADSGWSSRSPVKRLGVLNGTVREELIASKTSEEIVQLATKMANQSGLDIIRIRKPFHTDNPSVQGQWHPLTNKPSILTVQGPRLQPQ
uniref:Mitochondrial ribosomal protein L43 n=1 Tax=Cyanistes caeruleus TaxID=156563 RepID=A0A8C0TXK0_CYACU